MITLLVLGLAGGINLANQHVPEYKKLIESETVHQLSADRWWDSGWLQQPAWRIDLGGEKKTPLTIQWSGSREKLVEAFLANGWEKPASLSLKSFLNMLSPDAEIAELPVFPRFHKGQLEDVIMIRNVASERWILRLWETDYVLQPENFSLLIGTAEREGLRRIGKLVTIPVDLKKYQMIHQEITTPLCCLGRCRLAFRPAGQVESKRGINWTGKTILAEEHRGEAVQ
jgi:hypothetical protein